MIGCLHLALPELRSGNEGDEVVGILKSTNVLCTNCRVFVVKKKKKRKKEAEKKNLIFFKRRKKNLKNREIT